MGLVDHAKTELEIAGLFDEDSDYNGGIGEAVMELIEVFAKQGHSGMSAPYVASIFEKLANFKPLIGITGKDEEWSDVISELRISGVKMFCKQMPIWVIDQTGEIDWSKEHQDSCRIIMNTY